MSQRLFLALFCVLLIVRLPSLAQPAGPDQSLYAYAGASILQGGLPYRDAWDQKPPAVHFTYAAMRAIWAAEAVIPAADLAVAAAVALLLVPLGTALAGAGTGQVAALIFLLLSNPSFQRLAGVSVRAQCEVFIALAVTAAFLLIARARPAGAGRLFAAGALFGVAFAFKYNAGIYAAVGVAALALGGGWAFRRALVMAAGFAAPLALLAVVFAWGGALRDLYAATIDYNVLYSGETYRGPADFAFYLLTFPVQHARVDGLWLLGGAGCAVLLAASLRDRRRLFPVLWVAAACLSIAVNSSRGLPQYFVQAGPGLALAAAWALALVWTRRRAVNVAMVAVLAVALWRVNEFPKLADNTWHDARRLLGQSGREEHLARYGDRDTRKYSALAVAELSDFVAARTRPGEAIYVFGFSPGVYVQTGRPSASRFFWSRPVIVDFKAGEPGYGVRGLLDDLTLREPALVALQVRDWAPDVEDSAAFFMRTEPLARWLESHYTRDVHAPDGFDVWLRVGGRP
jgi:4-amino-4-deoxy-L-arabinose transferase-like glycosyltransferase